MYSLTSTVCGHRHAPMNSCRQGCRSPASTCLVGGQSVVTDKLVRKYMLVSQCGHQ